MTNAREPGSWNEHRSFRALGICWIVYGLARIGEAIWLVVFSGTATLMFGALLNRVADPFTLMNYFHLFYTAIIILSAVCGVVGILAGAALLGRSSSANSLAIAAAVLSVSSLPFGTILGVFTLVFLLGASSRAALGRAETPQAHHAGRQTSTSIGY